MLGREDHEPDGGVAVHPCLAELVTHLAARDLAVLRLDDDPQLGATRDRGVECEDEVALLGAAVVAGVGAGALDEVVGAPRDVPEHALDQVLEVAALRGRLGALAGPGGPGGLERGELLGDLLEPGRDLGPELMERRAEPSRIEQRREPRGIAVEVGLEHRGHAPDGRVATLGIEQFGDRGLQLAAIPEECLERPGQSALAVAEVRAEDTLQRLGRALVRGPVLLREAVELGAHCVEVDGHADALERGQPDPQGALDDDRAVLLRLARQPGGLRRVREGQAIDEDPLTVDADRRVRAARQGDDSCFHAEHFQGRE